MITKQEAPAVTAFFRIASQRRRLRLIACIELLVIVILAVACIEIRSHQCSGFSTVASAGIGLRRLDQAGVRFVSGGVA